VANLIIFISKNGKISQKVTNFFYVFEIFFGKKKITKIKSIDLNP